MAEDLDQVFRAPKATDPIRDRLGLERVGSARTTSTGSRGSSVGAVSHEGRMIAKHDICCLVFFRWRHHPANRPVGM